MHDICKSRGKWWKGLIPVYNSWIYTKISGLAWWWFVIYMSLATLISKFEEMELVLGIMLCLITFNYCYNLSKKFGKSDGFAVLLAFLPFVGFPILAFGSSKYEKTAKVDKNGIFKVD